MKASKTVRYNSEQFRVLMAWGDWLFHEDSSVVIYNLSMCEIVHGVLCDSSYRTAVDYIPL